jgi:sugar lactone lactonase YvrE
VNDPPFAISDVRLGLGESPLWHPVRQCLHVTDLNRGAVHVLDARLRELRTIELGRITTALTWQSDGSLLFFHDRCAITRLARDDRLEMLLEGLPGEEGGLFNDVIADSAGRVLCGTQPVGSRPGRLYCIEPDLTSHLLLEGLQEPNGLGFSVDGRTLYFCDSVARTIWQFPYDERNGRLGRPSVLFQRKDEVLPDGLTVDTQGFIWSAQWNGGAVLRLDPAGNVVRTLKLPALRTTSVGFGGSQFQTLYVTSAQADPASPSSEPGRYDGAVFALQGCGAGRPEFPSRLGSRRKISRAARHPG